MTFTRSSLIYLGVVGAFALGLAVGPLVGARRVSPVVVDTPPPAVVPAADAVASIPARTAPRLERVPTASAVPVQYVRTLLSRGTDVRKASEGFANAYQFMTVAHAARNTEIPFVVLKHRVLIEREALATAIASLKPGLDVSAEVTRARAAARADLARIAGA